MSDLTFTFDGHQVRVVEVSGEPLFVARDVASILGYQDTTQAVSNHCKKAKSLKDIDPSILRVQVNQSLSELDPKTKLIPESDVHRLIMQSKLPTAERFQDVVVEEILPAIRKTGSYHSKQLTPAEQALEHAKILVEQERKIEAVRMKQQQLQLQQDVLEEQVAQTKERLSEIFGGEVWISVKGYANKYNIRADRATLAKIGKVATRLCKEQAIEKQKIDDQNFGTVGVYPPEILETAFSLVTN